MLNKIIVGYDGSDHARDALTLGAALASATGATLLPTCVYQKHAPLPYGGYGYDEWEAAALSHALEIAAEAGAVVGEPVDPNAVGSRSPAHGLHDMATTESADLVVVGSAERGERSRISIRSVGRALLHGCPCAVAVAPAGFRLHGTHPFETIGVGYNGEPESELALAEAIQLAQTTGAALRIITIAMAPEGGFEAAGFYAAGSAELKQAMIDRMHSLMDKAVERARAAGVEASGKLEVGSRARLAGEVGLDLMVVGSRSYGPLRAALLGSVSKRLTDEGRFPVIVVPRGAKRAAGRESNATAGAATA